MNQKIQNTNGCIWRKVLHPVTVIKLTNLLRSWTILIKYPESARSKTKTRKSQNAFDSDIRLRPTESGLETGLKTKTNLEYYNTTLGVSYKGIYVVYILIQKQVTCT